MVRADIKQCQALTILFYFLLEYVKLETGLPMVLNTSLNARGKPICATIEQALDIFKTTEMDAICIGNEVYAK